MTLPVNDQKFMAFEGLMTWAKAVVLQATRLSAAQEEMVRQMYAFFDALKAGQAHTKDNPQRDLGHVFYAERLFFCIAAAKFFEYRKWIVDLRVLDPQIFAEIDKFEVDAKAMRNLNEHATEYFKGPGQRRKDWDANIANFNADPTGTHDTLIGGRLDWVKLGAAMATLIPTIPDMLPSIFQHRTT